uniref:Putative secreted salivary gland protein 2 n=1 Tax=Ixodes ricinus TaxID=34613 RepID=A0A090X7Y0_IXORI
MGLTGTALVLVSLAIFGSAAAHGCQKRNANPHRKKEREGCDFYCWNTVTNSWDKFFFEDGEQCFYNKWWSGNDVKNGDMPI